MKKMKLTESIAKDKDQYYVKTFSVVLNPYDNGGESVTLYVDVFDNGDKEDNIYTNTTVQVDCYGVHSTAIKLWGVDYSQLSDAIKLIDEAIKKKENTCEN